MKYIYLITLSIGFLFGFVFLIGSFLYSFGVFLFSLVFLFFCSFALFATIENFDNL